MTESTKRILFDSYAVLKWIQSETGYKKIKSYISACQAKTITGFINQVNLGEVYYKSIRTAGIERAKDFLENFYRLEIRIIVPDSDLIWKAAEIKAEYSISYADCFAVATALKFKATILTGDPEFKKVKKIIPVEWV